MIPLLCVWAKSNKRMRGQSECDMTWFCFCFDFIRSYAQCGCFSMVCWRGLGEVWWGIFLKLDAQGQEGKNISEVDGQGLGGFEN